MQGVIKSDIIILELVIIPEYTLYSNLKKNLPIAVGGFFYFVFNIFLYNFDVPKEKMEAITHIIPNI